MQLTQIDLFTPPQEPTGHALERFMKFVQKQPNGCWNWVGSMRGHEGEKRGQFRYRGKNWVASRASWILHRGEIPNGELVLHTCIGNPICVNPEHLYLGNQWRNMQDRKEQGRGWYHKGEIHPNAKLTEELVTQIRQEHKKLPRMGALIKLSARFGVPRTTVSAVVNRYTWTHIP